MEGLKGEGLGREGVEREGLEREGFKGITLYVSLAQETF
jgi:hypothetical protein